MQMSIWFSGPAGAGVMTVWNMLGKLLAKKWYYVVGDKQYESIIKWWNNLFVLYISDQKNYLSQHIDYLFSYDAYALEKNESVYEIGKNITINKADCNYQNTYSLAMALKLLWLKLDETKSYFEKKYDGDVLEKNLSDLDSWYAGMETWNQILQDLWTAKEFLTGNQIIAEGAVASDLWYYAAYPMTPASSIINQILKHKEVTFFQWEDEIAVSMSMLGAHFAGKRAMCGTSGGGFALMTESISYANMAELGWVYILSQRAGPSTGTPTFTEQWDLTFALNASFGDTFPIVCSPDSLEHGYNLIGKVLNRSDQYQHPIVYLVDKSFSETSFAIDSKDLHTEEVERWKLLKNGWDEKFARYAITEDGVSPYTVPGTKNGTFIASSYEHDIYGATSENPLEKKIMTQKRHKKMQTFVKEVFTEKFKGYEIINPDANKFLISFGFNSYALRNFVDLHKDWGLIIVTVLQPINPQLSVFLQDRFEWIDKLVFVEQNYSGQFEKHIKVECGLMTPEREQKISHYRKYTLYPIFDDELDFD